MDEDEFRQFYKPKMDRSVSNVGVRCEGAVMMFAFQRRGQGRGLQMGMSSVPLQSYLVHGLGRHLCFMKAVCRESVLGIHGLMQGLKLGGSVQG